jgi:hypothetical protein
MVMNISWGTKGGKPPEFVNKIIGQFEEGVNVVLHGEPEWVGVPDELRYMVGNKKEVKNN